MVTLSLAHEDERVSSYCTLLGALYVQKHQRILVLPDRQNPQRNKRQAARLRHETEDRRWGSGGVLLCCRSLIKDRDPGEWSDLISGRHTVGVPCSRVFLLE